MLTAIPGSDPLYAPGSAILGGLALPPPVILTWAHPMYYGEFSDCSVETKEIVRIEPRGMSGRCEARSVGNERVSGTRTPHKSRCGTNHLGAEEVLSRGKRCGERNAVFTVVRVDDVACPLLSRRVKKSGRVDLGPDGALSVKRRCGRRCLRHEYCTNTYVYLRGGYGRQNR